MEKPQLTAEQRQEVEKQLELIRRGTVEVVPEEELEEKVIRSVVRGKPLRVKLGLDPTAPDIHIGHTVVLHKLRHFQQLGHEVDLIIGDFTGRIGDPTGKSETRKPLTEDEVKRNAETYQKQIFKILDPEKTTVHFNSAWLMPLRFADVVELAAKTTVARMLERDDFEQRYRTGQAISLHEFFHPLMQGYDSVALKSDIELGGTDQKFNLLMGRALQKEYGLPSQVAIMMPLIEGLDGTNKMSKSLGNYIGIDEPPNEVYGKAMSIPDELMVKYYELATDISNEDLEKLKRGLADGSVHPRDAKMRLARTFVAMYHGGKEAERAEEHFRTVFQQREMPEDIPEKSLDGTLLEEGHIRIVSLLVALGLASSNGEARRSIAQGAVRINGQKVSADAAAVVAIQEGDVVQVGRRKFAKVTIS